MCCERDAFTHIHYTQLLMFTDFSNLFFVTMCVFSPCSQLSYSLWGLCSLNLLPNFTTIRSRLLIYYPQNFNTQQKCNSNHNLFVSARSNLFGAPGHELRLHTPAARLPGDSTSGVVTDDGLGRPKPSAINLLNTTLQQIFPRDDYTTQGTQPKKKIKWKSHGSQTNMQHSLFATNWLLTRAVDL